MAQLLAFVIIGSAMAGVLLFVRNREVSPYTDDASIDADVVRIAALCRAVSCDSTSARISW